MIFSAIVKKYKLIIRDLQKIKEILTAKFDFN